MFIAERARYKSAHENAGALRKSARGEMLTRLYNESASGSLETRRVLSGEFPSQSSNGSDSGFTLTCGEVPLRDCMRYHPESYAYRDVEEVWQSQKDERTRHSEDKARQTMTSP